MGFGHLEPNNIKEIFKQHYQGSQYSFGYPACPNMQDQYVQLDLLDTKRIGMYRSSSEQIYPEQSTGALPKAQRSCTSVIILWRSILVLKRLWRKFSSHRN